jgi:hypothetical protein
VIPVVESPIADTPDPIERVGTPVPLWLTEFLTELEVTPLLDGRNWRVDQGFVYESAHLGRILEIPTGFITDFASIPRVLWDLLPPTGKYSRAAVVHDYLYRTLGVASRADADAVLLEAMKILGVDELTQLAIYDGVRVGGHWSYKGGL